MEQLELLALAILLQASAYLGALSNLSLIRRFSSFALSRASRANLSGSNRAVCSSANCFCRLSVAFLAFNRTLLIRRNYQKNNKIYTNVYINIITTIIIIIITPAIRVIAITNFSGKAWPNSHPTRIKPDKPNLHYIGSFNHKPRNTWPVCNSTRLESTCITQNGFYQSLSTFMGP